MFEIHEAVERVLMEGPIEIEQSLNHMNIRLIRNNKIDNVIMWQC
jgi:hypothetical protein